MWDSSISYSIQPKLDMWLFVDFCVLPKIYLSWTKNCSVLMFKTILGSAQVNSGQNTEIIKQSHVKFWLNWINYEAVLYSLNCTKLIPNDQGGQEPQKRHLQQSMHSKCLTKSAIITDYRHFWLLCIALPPHQKLVHGSGFKTEITKKNHLKKCAPETLIFHKKIRKMRMIFDLENSLWKYNFGLLISQAKHRSRDAYNWGG